MAGGTHDSSLTRVQPFFGALVEADPSGESWLRDLLSCTQHPEACGPALADPGTLLRPLTRPNGRGRLGCFEYPVPPPRALLAWFVENPQELVWPKAQSYSRKTTQRRKALIDDSPRGAQVLAQAEARKLVAERATGAAGWWRFEGTSRIDCVLMTDKLVVTIEGKRTEPISPSTDWYPKRSQLVRNLEAAKQLSRGRQWATMLVSEDLVDEATDEALEADLPRSAPHLARKEQDQLHAHYLGNITWRQACQATGVDFASLPRTTDDL